ncbi:hypothetical protein OB69_02170 [Roseivirga seohaensis subsp. aquiponti]|uniref:Uncharacterized protein n=1 Tax=Roseivirga seohaensis subsp. aquiponti TaxID=1566026 RepID=A0A0L8APD2_9BACT|nr:hypothetical protein [Roseivirga seohaensis]KOF04343.1 hypothetical protein OB69_02170 [Roseivirga seohaensis subsp. aquiponti]
MIINKFPGTHITAELLNPKHSNFCEVFYENPPLQPEVVMGSVNAGTSYTGSLFVMGQEGMTGAFYGILSVQQNFVGKHPYQKIHKTLHRLAENKETAHIDNFDSDFGVQFALVQKPPLDTACIDFDGTVFVDIFKDHLRPYQIDANYAMIYVVPPLADLYSTPNDFLNAIEDTAENIIRAVMYYNKNFTLEKSPNSLNLKPINTIRVCLFSTGYFNTFQMSHDQIASYIYHGIASQLHSAETYITNVQFENNYHEVMATGLKSETQDFNILRKLMAE